MLRDSRINLHEKFWLKRIIITLISNKWIKPKKVWTRINLSYKKSCLYSDYTRIERKNFTHTDTRTVYSSRELGHCIKRSDVESFRIKHTDILRISKIYISSDFLDEKITHAAWELSAAATAQAEAQHETANPEQKSWPLRAVGDRADQLTHIFGRHMRQCASFFGGIAHQ